MGLPLANKPWQAGKSHVDGGFAGKIIHLYGGFSSVMFDYRKVQINPMAIYRHLRRWSSYDVEIPGNKPFGANGGLGSSHP